MGVTFAMAGSLDLLEPLLYNILVLIAGLDLTTDTLFAENWIHGHISVNGYQVSHFLRFNYFLFFIFQVRSVL